MLVSFEMPELLNRHLEELAEAAGQSKSRFLREIIIDFLRDDPTLDLSKYCHVCNQFDKWNCKHKSTSAMTHA